MHTSEGQPRIYADWRGSIRRNRVIRRQRTPRRWNCTSICVLWVSRSRVSGVAERLHHPGDELGVGVGEAVVGQLARRDPADLVARQRARLAGLVATEERVQADGNFGVVVLDNGERAGDGGGDRDLLGKLAREA